MSSFDDRRKALENKFFHDEDMKFKIISRRRKLLGLWAAGHMHLTEEASLSYALDIVNFGIEDTRDGAVIGKILADVTDSDAKITEEDIREKMNELQILAAEQLLAEANISE